MAPSRKPSRQVSNLAARTPPETPRNPRQQRRRSASPPDQSTSVRTRDEPPARSTRSWTQAPAFADAIRPIDSQKNPVECPYVGCSASTVHQHRPHLQYYLPRPGRAIYHHGYGKSNDDTPSPPSLVLTLRLPRPDQQVSHAQPKTAEKEEEDAEPEPLAQESEQAESSPKAAEENRDAPATPDSPTAKALTSTLHDPPPTPPPSSPIPTSEAHPAHPTQQPLSEHHSQPPPASPAIKPDHDTLPQSQEPPPIPTSEAHPQPPPQEPLTTPSPPPTHTYTYDELIRPLAQPTAPPAPGMAHMTQILQDLSRDIDSQRHRVGETEYMRQFREYNNEYDNRHLQQYDEEWELGGGGGGGGEEFDWDTYMWQ